MEGSSGAGMVATARVAHPVPKGGPPCPHPAVPPCRDPPSRSPAAHRSTPRRSPMHEGPFTPLPPLSQPGPLHPPPTPRGCARGGGAPQHPKAAPRYEAGDGHRSAASCSLQDFGAETAPNEGRRPRVGLARSTEPPHGHSHPSVHLPQSRRSPRERRPEPVGAHGAILPQPAGLTSGTSISMEITGSDSFPLTGAVGLQETCEK